MIDLNKISFNDITDAIIKLKETIDNLIKELQELFENVIDAYEYEDTKQKIKYNLNKSKYTRENDYYKNQFKLTKRHVCIRNKYKR